MRNLFIGLLTLSLLINFSACARFQIEEYIKTGQKEYTRQVEADVEKVYDAVKVVLDRHGWKIVKVEDPSIYERSEYEMGATQKRYLLFTDIKEEDAFIDANYVHLNIYLYQVHQWTDLEVRYHSVKNLVKNFNNYRNDRLVIQIIDEIEKELGVQ